MADQEPTTRTMKASEARRQFSRVINNVFRHEMRVLVEKSGIPVAAIVSAEDLQRIDQWERAHEERWRVIDEIHARNVDKNPEEVERDVAAAVAAVRRQGSRQRRRRVS